MIDAQYAIGAAPLQDLDASAPRRAVATGEDGPDYSRVKTLYLELLEQTLTGAILEDAPMAASGATTYDPNIRTYGWDWPAKAVTMVGLKRLQNLRTVIESVIFSGTPGDIVETGVWRGGASILARAVLEVYGQKSRRVIVCDSFEGLPPPNAETFPADEGSTFHTHPELVVSLDAVRDNFRRFGLLDDQVVFVKGWFRDTMPLAPVETIAVLRLDGDMYESTIDPLNHLYDRISIGGWVIVDDYEVVPAAKKAVHDFLDSRGVSPTIHPIDGVGVFFRKDA